MKIYDASGKPMHYTSDKTKVEEKIKRAKLERKAKEVAEGVEVTHMEGVTLIDDETKAVVYGPKEQKSTFKRYIIAGFTEGELTILSSLNLLELFVAGKTIQETFIENFNKLTPEEQEQLKKDIDKLINMQGGEDEEV